MLDNISECQLFRFTEYLLQTISTLINTKGSVQSLGETETSRNSPNFQLFHISSTSSKSNKSKCSLSSVEIFYRLGKSCVFSHIPLGSLAGQHLIIAFLTKGNPSLSL